jgi:DNA polymerase Ligase (LigD)
MPRFVILEHDWPQRHWDLMLEAEGVLRTWRLAAPLTPGVDIPAEPIGAHRLLYLDYEGPVSGNRGFVKRWDWGTFDWQTGATGVIAVYLSGEVCKGMLEIQSEAGVARLIV